jgi:aspartate racemase
MYVGPRTPQEKKLSEIWAEVLSLDNVGIYDDFFELGGHSLLAARLLAEIERKLGLRTPLSALLGAPTVEQLAALLFQKIEAATNSLIPVQTGGSRPPFFCVHGADGYIHFRRHLGSDQPFYGLAQHFSGREVRYTRIPEIAAHYIREMRSVQPEGPYFLGGHSMGGTIAFEMAQQFKKQGEDVALLVLLDSGPPRGSEIVRATRRLQARGRSYLRRLYQNISRMSLGRLIEQIHSFTAYEMKLLACRMHHLFRVVLPPSLQAFYIDQVVYGKLYPRAMRQYRPEVYSGSVVYFKSELDTRPSIAAWQKKVGGPFEVYRVPGDHFTMLQEPHVGHLIDTLKDCLSNTQSQYTSPVLINRRKVDLLRWKFSKARFLERTWVGRFLNEDAK